MELGGLVSGCRTSLNFFGWVTPPFNSHAPQEQQTFRFADDVVG